MLVETGNGFINTDHIISAKCSVSASGEEQLRLRMIGGTDGPVAPISSHELPLERLCGVIVPAQPGFVLIKAFLPGPGEERGAVYYSEKPIIAFRIIGGTDAPQPITLAGEPLDRSDVRWIVRQPDGRGVDCGGETMTIEAFKDDCLSHADSLPAYAA